MYHCPVHQLAASVLAYIGKHDLIRAGDRVAVAVSGGADSVALLRLMLELRDELGLVLSIVHFNHCLRGADSDADEQFVRELADAHDLEITCETCDVKSFAAEKKLSLEAAARDVRYEFFRRMLQSRVNRVATAHTMDDQAETVLLKLGRGSGTRGLAGIFPKVRVGSALQSAGAQPDAAVVRPLLAVRRYKVLEFLAEIGQPWREDATNQDLHHARNRVRHEILPRLERELNPGITDVLAEAAEIARAEEEYWATESDRLLPQIFSRDGDTASLQIKVLGTFPVALQRRLVRAAAESMGLTLNFSHVEEVLGLQRQGECSSLPAGWKATRRADKLVFEACSQPGRDYEYALTIPGTITVPEAAVTIEVIRISGAPVDAGAGDGVFDSRFGAHPLLVRNWRPGERFWPAHSKEPKKIKELLQDRHITGERKRLWPVIASGDEIVWLRGFGVRRDFQAKHGEGILIREIPSL